MGENNPVQAEIFDFLGFTHLFSSFIFLSLAALLLPISFLHKGMFINA